METDVLVIGAGIAGLMTALTLAPKSVILLSKGPLGEEASSSWAQGGISAALSKEDTPAHHQHDTMAVAGGLSDADVAKLVTELGPKSIDALINLGVVFDKNGSDLDLRKEAAHSHRRVVHANGDATGREIMRALKVQVLEASHITVLEHAEALDLIVDQKTVVGADILHQDKSRMISAHAVVLATGGIGQIFSATTNPHAASGDGLAMAGRAGARLKDLEFIQFHPTAINVDAIPLPLATEALRGEGAILVNDLKECFMISEHRLADLAPRDIVARGIWKQMELGRQCFLDARQSVGQEFPKSFPTVFQFCQDHDIDPRQDLIPIVPAAHYHMGGVESDEKGRTSLPALWACGEVACTGLHGANRLASNSLLEALVFAPLVAEDIKKQRAGPHSVTPSNYGFAPTIDIRSEEEAAIRTIQSLNYRYLGLCRDSDGLTHLLSQLREIEAHHLFPCPRLQNILTCSRMIATAALRRCESRGSHYRTDFPISLYEFSDHSYLTNEDCGYELTGTNLPLAS